MPSGSSILRQLIPSIPSLLLGGVALLVFLAWFLLSLAMVLDPLDGDTMLGAAATVGAVVFGPLAALFLAVAGLVERRVLAQAGWFYLAGLAVLSSGLILGLFMAIEPWVEGTGNIDGESLGLGVFGGTCCGFGPMCIFLLPAMAYTLRGLRELREGSNPGALSAVVALLHRRGCASFEEITAVSDIPPDRIEAALFRLRQQGRLLCRVEPNAGWVCTQRHEHEGLRILPGLLAARARIELEELGRELHVPPPVLRAWIYKAVGAGELQGYMDWNKGVIYSREARKLRDARRCPGCGGQLELVGRGVVQCPFCDTEIFL